MDQARRLNAYMHAEENINALSMYNKVKYYRILLLISIKATYIKIYLMK